MSEESKIDISVEMDNLQKKVSNLTQEIVTLSRDDLIKALDHVISKNLRENEKLEELRSIKTLLILFGTLGVTLALGIIFILVFTVPA